MSVYQHHEMYYDNPSRSPGTHRHQQTLHRQPSRQFDAYAAPSNGLYTAEDHAAHNYLPRYNGDRLNATLHSNYGGYDLGGSQAWNTFNANHNNTLTAIGATTRMKSSSRGRSALPTVRLIAASCLHCTALIFVDTGLVRSATTTLIHQRVLRSWELGPWLGVHATRRPRL